MISLGTGQLTSRYMGNMLESGSSSNVMQMDQKDDQQMIINKKLIHKQKKIS